MSPAAESLGRLAFQPLPRSQRPSRALELRITVSESENNDTGLVWNISGLQPGPGGKGRTASSAAAILGILGIRLSEMKAAVRRQIAS